MPKVGLKVLWHTQNPPMLVLQLCPAIQLNQVIKNGEMNEPSAILSQISENAPFPQMYTIY